MTFWCGSGSGSADPCLWLINPDPVPSIFIIDLQDTNKKLIFLKRFSCILLYGERERTIAWIYSGWHYVLDTYPSPGHGTSAICVADPVRIRIFSIPDPGSKRFPDHGSVSTSKNLSILAQKIVSRVKEKSSKKFIPDPVLDFFTHPGSRIQGSKRHRLPDQDPQHCLTWSSYPYTDKTIEVTYGTFCLWK